ncbi:MAG: ABC transporter ATP-binding protein/permease [Lachnospiraceae bacterium]|nr:ABC transporter ATP-binding protein/permease [Lachnospiraceae bacterium]
MRFIKNFRGSEFSCLLIICFLFVQAMCDLSLPNYTSKLIDTGIINSGIEYGIPEKISEESYMGISMFLTKEERKDWFSLYKKGDKVSRSSNDDEKYEITVYELKNSDKNNLEELEEEYSTSIMLYYMSLQGGFGEGTMSFGADPGMSTDSGDASSSLMKLDDETILRIRKGAEEKISTLGDSMVHSSTVAFVKNEYEKIGLDLNKQQTQYLFATGAKMIAMTLLMVLAAVFVGFFASRVGAKIGRDLREKVFKNVMNFSESEMKKFSTASLITRSTNDVQQVQMVSVLMLRMVAYAPILAIGGIIMVIRTHSGMEWIIVVAIALLMCLVAFLMLVAMPKFKLMQDLVDRVNLVSREILTGIPVIRAFSREKLEEKRFDDANENLTKVMLFTNRAMSFMMPAMMLIMNGISILIVWVATHKIDNGTLEVGTMTAFITYTMQIVLSFLMLSVISILLPRATVASDRIKEVVETNASVVDVYNAKDINDIVGVVEFENVSFSYPDAEETVLNDISFVAKPGTTTAVIGSTGSGKSTLVQLILRFYDVTKGSIKIDGNDIRDFTQKSLRNNMGYVPQKGVLFSGTIESNIKYGASDITDDNMKNAATIAQATEFIEQKAEKYNSEISQGGTNVSGGQKQRLSIARAIARKPKIFIFDDSFSALDFKTDAMLRKALSNQIKDATVFIVAQRISTILEAEQIIVLDEGNVAGIGNHFELMKNCEVYRQIAESQLSPKEIEDSLKREDR